MRYGRRCAVLATCLQTGTSSRCRWGNLADRTSGFTTGRSDQWIVVRGMPVTSQRALPPT
jgi:hypothetical protein